ncbi:hypothetical protein Pla52o_47540 [Novipirellula galeiformis]|uniref:Uncharacterized protein n=1 Tax=Novipirellula galeiformis TaxID=2528004 RepID=A0A5C6CBP1_9BACT|nr:hypothetical protein Pla52o_47540 [Novipirellula galeiformis]
MTWRPLQVSATERMGDNKLNLTVLTVTNRPGTFAIQRKFTQETLTERCFKRPLAHVVSRGLCPGVQTCFSRTGNTGCRNDDA